VPEVVYLKSVSGKYQVFGNSVALNAEHQITAEPNGVTLESIDLSTDKASVVYEADGKVRVAVSNPATPANGTDIETGDWPAYSYDGKSVLFWKQTNQSCVPTKGGGACILSRAVFSVPAKGGTSTQVGPSVVLGGGRPTQASNGMILFPASGSVQRIDDVSTSSAALTPSAGRSYNDPTFIGSATTSIFVADDTNASTTAVTYSVHSQCVNTTARCLAVAGFAGIEPYVGVQGTRVAYVNSTTDSDGDVCVTQGTGTTTGQVCTSGGGRRYPAIR
jgi:hypothetical protein